MQVNVIHQMDCIDGLRSLPPGVVDVIVTSPPYNLNKKYSAYNDNLDEAEYIEWLTAVATECKRVLKPDGSFFLNIGYAVKNPYMPFQVALAFRPLFHLQNVIHWIKSISIDGNSIGHYTPIQSARYHYNGHEYVLHFTHDGTVPLDKTAIGVPYKDKSNITRWKSPKADVRDRGNFWYIPYDTIQRSRVHPAPFPVMLPEMCIKDHGVERTKLVVDTFVGIGTTACACVRMGIDYIGFEIDKNYIQFAESFITEEEEKVNYHAPPLQPDKLNSVTDE